MLLYVTGSVLIKGVSPLLEVILYAPLHCRDNRQCPDCAGVLISESLHREFAFLV